ncbi:MAG: hypothetical protein NVSMB6_08440 [Burkholderiaceae bacterium]
MPSQRLEISVALFEMTQDNVAGLLHVDALVLCAPFRQAVADRRSWPARNAVKAAVRITSYPRIGTFSRLRTKPDAADPPCTIGAAQTPAKA